MIYNYVDQPFPIPEPQTTVGQEAERLWKKAAGLHDKLEDVDAKAYHARRAVRDAQEALRSHLRQAAMDGKTASREKALTDALRKAEAVADEPWPEREEAARQASSAAEGEVTSYIAAHGLALLEEMRAEAEDTAQRVAVALEHLGSAFKDYNSTRARVVALTRRVPEIDDRDVANLSGWADDLSRVLLHHTDHEIPAPFVREAILAWVKGEQPRASIDVSSMLGS